MAKKAKRKPMTETEIADLAEKIYKGSVFTDRHLQNPEDATMVFMVLMFMDKKSINKLAKEVGMIYEDLAAAGPRAINGMPMFFSCKTVSKADAPKVWEKYEKIKAAMEEAKKA